MKKYPAIHKALYKILRLKPSPLRQGGHRTFIFIHINKTAGTSIGKAIGLPVKDHLTAKEIIARIGKEKWNTAYKFTFVRNPWDKVVSHYEYRRKKDKTHIATRDISFKSWVKMTYGEKQDPAYYDNPKSFQPQVEWLKDDKGKISIDFLGRFESINKDFDHVKRIIGIDAGLPHLNASKRIDYRSYYDDETTEIIARWFSEDISMFDYRFNN